MALSKLKAAIVDCFPETYQGFEPYDEGDFLPDSDYNCQTVVGINVPSGWLLEDIKYNEIKERLNAKEVAFKRENYHPPGKSNLASSTATFFNCQFQNEPLTLVLHATPIQ